MKHKIQKIFLIFSIFLLGFCFASETDYFKIYNELEVADFSYISGIDPYQNEDYVRYKFSPYPLLRSGVDFRFKNIVIPSGYYLLTPRSMKGKDYVLFKQQGRVMYTIPVYKKVPLDPTFYKLHVPKVKKNLWNKAGEKLSNMVGRISKDSKRTPAPQAYIEVNEVQNTFWELILYYGNFEYHLLFLKD